MKLVITVPWGERLGGAENVLWTFLRHVDRQQVQPTIVFLQHGPFEQEVAALNLKTVVMPAGRLRHVHSLLRSIREMGRLLRFFRPDIVLNWSAKTHLYGAPAASLAGMSDRLVWWQQGIPNGHWMDQMATLLPSRAVGCYSSLAKLAQESHWPRRHTFVVHPGVDTPTVLTKEARIGLRNRLAIPSDQVVIGIVGRLQPWKGQHRFLRALADLHARGHRVHGLLVGGNAYNLSPGYETQLRELARKLRVDKSVTFTGQVADAGPYLQLMDVSVNASIGEPFGLVLIEAMALSVPVVAFSIGGPTEILDSGRAGVLVPVGGQQALADALEQLVVDGDRRHRLALAGCERYRSFFSAERMAQQMQTSLLGLCHV